MVGGSCCLPLCRAFLTLSLVELIEVLDITEVLRKSSWRKLSALCVQKVHRSSLTSQRYKRGKKKFKKRVDMSQAWGNHVEQLTCVKLKLEYLDPCAWYRAFPLPSVAYCGLSDGNFNPLHLAQYQEQKLHHKASLSLQLDIWFGA